ncbi:MAG: DNA polymerase/3'-5' exonuclease PolX [Methanobacteriota archaeon]|nr:MAG: DNA polymerase/3'-5' exonuclease PolX [Euryarchaeota archaeon]
MKNQEIAEIFNEIADMLDILGEDSFRIISYRRAARQMEALTEDVEDLVRQGRVGSIPGIGAALGDKIEEYVTAGKVGYHQELRAKFPPGVLDMLRVRGIGPKKVKVLWQELGISDIETLRTAAQTHRLRRVKGFGEKTEEKILRSIELLKEGESVFLLATAHAVADVVLGYLRERAPIHQVAAAGSLRRMKETVRDIDVLATTDKPAAVVEAFTHMPGVREVIAAGERKSVVLFDVEDRFVQIDLRIIEPGSWGAALQYDTGNKDHNIHLRTMAEKRGLKLNEYGIFRDDTKVAGETEESVYSTLGLPWIPPEMREDQGEIELAAKGGLPTLVEDRDMHGEFHVHTNATDGLDPVETMVDTARARGYEYIGISDHSVSSTVAFGLTADAALARRDRFRELNRERKGFTVLLGTECDILDGGEMDYKDEVLKEFDFVIAAVHSRFTLPIREMTARVVAAIRNPYVNILAHPTTRKIGQRDPVQIDLDELYEACASTGTAIEIDAYPDRMDLNGTQARAAKNAGCTISVDTDSHAKGHLAWIRFGVGTARRAWLTREDVLNAWPLEKVRAFLR